MFWRGCKPREVLHESGGIQLAATSPVRHTHRLLLGRTDSLCRTLGTEVQHRKARLVVSGAVDVGEGKAVGLCVKGR